MIPSDDDIKRQVIPRWRSLRATAASGELGSSAPRQLSHLDAVFSKRLYEEFSARLQDWRKDQDIASAEELIAAAMVVRREASEEVRSAAELVLNDRDVLPGSKDVARAIIGLRPGESDLPGAENTKQLGIEIARRRGVLRRYPRDALLLAETALLYTTLGMNRAASELLKKAAAISPDDRYVLRSLTRFWVHSNDPDRALFHLSKSSATKFDPWLLAAHLAAEDISQKTPSLWRVARRMLEKRSHTDFELNELAAATATLDLEAGSFIRARKMFRRSLAAPTENSLAQAQWAHRRDPSINASAALKPDAFEALAWEQLEAKRWNGAVEATASWQDLEPFSVRPAIMGSFIAVAHLGIGDRAEIFCRRGLIANGGSTMLHNNLAVALAIQGKTEEASTELDQLKEPRAPEEKIIRLATRGLIEMRQGNLAKGGDLYRQSMERALSARNAVLWCRAAANVTYEFARYDKSGMTEAIATIESVYDRLSDRTKASMSDVPALLLRAKGVKSASEALKSASEFRNDLVEYQSVLPTLFEQ